MKNSKKTSFMDAVLNPQTKGLQVENQTNTPAAILDAATINGTQTMPQTDVSEVPTLEGQISEAAEKFIFAPLRNGATFPDALDFSKFVFELLGTSKTIASLAKSEDYQKAFKIIKETHEKRTDKVITTWNFIDQHYDKWINPEKYKNAGSSEKTPIKAKTEKPTYTKEQQTTLDSLANNPLLVSAYEATKAVFDADLENRIQVWVKETAENDRKSKSTFVKNFIRQCNDVAFLNSLFDLCKEQEDNNKWF